MSKYGAAGRTYFCMLSEESASLGSPGQKIMFRKMIATDEHNFCDLWSVKDLIINDFLPIWLSVSLFCITSCAWTVKAAPCGFGGGLLRKWPCRQSYLGLGSKAAHLQQRALHTGVASVWKTCSFTGHMGVDYGKYRRQWFWSLNYTRDKSQDVSGSAALIWTALFLIICLLWVAHLYASAVVSFLFSPTSHHKLLLAFSYFLANADIWFHPVCVTSRPEITFHFVSCSAYQTVM